MRFSSRGHWAASETEAQAIKVTLQASTGAKILVWHQDDMFHAERVGPPTAAGGGIPGEPQVCMAIDLFEVVAELAGLDLERGEGAREAMMLAGYAQRRLLAGRREAPGEWSRRGDSS